MRRIAPIFLALCLAPGLAAADDDFYVFEKELATEFIGNRFSGNGFDSARNQLHTLYNAARAKARTGVIRSQGVILSVALTEWGVTDDDRLKVELTGWAVNDGRRSLYRRRGTIHVLFTVPAGAVLAADVAGAHQLDSRSLVKIEVLAKRIGRSGWLKTPLEQVEISLDELCSIQRTPTLARRTGVGSLLRRSWTKALGGNADDINIEADLTINLRSVRYRDGSYHMTRGATLSAKTADLVLGRRFTSTDWYQKQLRRFKPLPEADDLTADALVKALQRTNSRWSASTASQADWTRVQTLRRSDPSTVSQADRVFLAGTSGAAGHLFRASH